MKYNKNVIKKWDIFEIETEINQKFSNPFIEVEMEALFTNGQVEKRVNGFYDGNNTWRIRFMPEELGEYSFSIRSNIPEYNGLQGSFVCVEPSPGNHGPIRVSKKYHFSYADLTPFFVMGTTAYAWAYMPEKMRKQTLEAFKKYNFNKIRMLFFPKHLNGFEDIEITYEPPVYPFKGEKGSFDFRYFNVDYFRNFEDRVEDLMKLGIEADVILFHFYDFGQWGIDAGMKLEDELFYLKYIISRLGAYRNVWWSLANEYDMMVDYSTKKFWADPYTKYWDSLGAFVQQNDPYNHLRSIHNMKIIYPQRPWVTHVSYQFPNTYSLLLDLKHTYGMPVVNDEYQYEGNLKHNWGNSKPERVVFAHWLSAMAGGYATHGETYIIDGNRKDIFWAYGGTLVGESPRRLQFMKTILEQCPYQEMESDLTRGDGINVFCLKKEIQVYLYFVKNASEFKGIGSLYLRNDKAYEVTIYDVWNCEIGHKFNLSPEENEFLSKAPQCKISDWSVIKFEMK